LHVIEELNELKESATTAESMVTRLLTALCAETDELTLYFSVCFKFVDIAATVQDVFGLSRY